MHARRFSNGVPRREMFFSNAATGIAVVFGEAFASQAEQAFHLVFLLKFRCSASPHQVSAVP